MFPLFIASATAIGYMLGKVGIKKINTRILLGFFLGLLLTLYIYRPYISRPVINIKAHDINTEVISAYATSIESVISTYSKYNTDMRFDKELLSQQYELVEAYRPISKKTIAIYNKRTSTTTSGQSKSAGYRSIHTYLYGLGDKYFVVQVKAESYGDWINPKFSILSTKVGTKSELGQIMIGDNLYIKDVSDKWPD